MEQWRDLLRTETERVGAAALLGSLAFSAHGYLLLLARATKRSPNEIMTMGALGVEQGYEDL